ncbi:MAG: MFS transporter [Pseudomonadota bacterium]
MTLRYTVKFSHLALGTYFDNYPIVHLLPILIISLALIWIHSLSLKETQLTVVDVAKGSFWEILKQPAVISLFTVCFLVQASHGPYYTFFSIYLEANNYSNTFIGIAWAIGVIAEVFVYLVIHKAIKKWSLRWLMIMVLILSITRWVMIALFVDSIFLLVLAQCLHAASFGVYHAVAIQYINRQFTGIHQGRGQALYSSISFGAGLALGTLVSGFMWETIGAMQTFLFAASVSALALIIAIRGLSD